MNIEDSRHRFEALKMARELLNEEYINRRAEDHNKWIAECDVAWKTKGIKLPYPAFAPYPSEAEILARASTLYSFISSKALESTEPSTPDVSPWVTHLSSPLLAPAPQLEVEETPSLNTEPVVEISAVQEPEPEPVITKPLFAVAPSPGLVSPPAVTSTIKSMLPSWLQNKDNNV